MTEPCGRAILCDTAPAQAVVLDQLEAGAWQAMREADRVDLFDLAAHVVALQHDLPRLPRPAPLSPSPWTRAQAIDWRRLDDLDEAERAALAFAEQVAFCVGSTQPDHREGLFDGLGSAAVPFTQAIYVADMLPRARAALDALFGASDWTLDSSLESAPLDTTVNDLIRIVPGLQAIDAVTTELVRLLGARRHACRVCQSVRSYSALEAGANDAMFDAVEAYATGDFSPAQRAALAWTDGMISSPARFEGAVVTALLEEFEAAACVELVLDVTRNATNKIAVALGGDAPRVETGYEIYEVKPDGEIEYGLEAP